MHMSQCKGLQSEHVHSYGQGTVADGKEKKRKMTSRGLTRSPRGLIATKLEVFTPSSLSNPINIQYKGGGSLAHV